MLLEDPIPTLQISLISSPIPLSCCSHPPVCQRSQTGLHAKQEEDA